MLKQGSRRSWRRWFLVLTAAGVTLLVVSLVVSAVLGANRGYKFLYPARSHVCCTTPTVPYQEVSFPTSDGLTLRGWYLASTNHAAVIVAHGLGGNRLGVLPIGEFLARHGYGVLLLDICGRTVKVMVSSTAMAGGTSSRRLTS